MRFLAPLYLVAAFALALNASAGQTSFDYKGLTYVSWQASEYQSSDSDASLTDMRRSGANWVALLVTWYMPTGTSTTIASDSRTPTDAALAEAIADIKARGMKVLLKPHVDCDDGTWRGQINISAANKPAWFSSYTAFITHYAALAETHGVEMLCMGTELKTMSNSNLASWTAVITSVRAAYSGPLVYAANAYAPADEYANVVFWSQLDYAGANCYTPLTSITNPTFAQIKAGWTSGRYGWNMLSSLRSWAGTVGKPVIMTEMGYQSADGCNKDPNWVPTPVTQDLQEQADCYQAAFEVLSQESWCKGIFWWGWEVPLPAATDTHFSPRGKPAGTVVADWYRGTNASPTVSTISATPSTVAAPGQVSFSVAASDAEWDPLTYSWNFADGGSMSTASGTHTFTNGGIYNVTVTISDDHGGSVQASVTVTVTPVTPNQPPIVVSPATASPPETTVGVPVAFSVAASDADSDPLLYNWNFADGGSMNTASGMHAFASAGTFLVRVTITDGRGGSVSSSVSVTVNAPLNPQPPPSGPAHDLDGDGFPNELELAMGTSPLDAGSTPLGGAPAPAALPVGSVKLNLKLNFTRGASDSLSFSGTLPNVAAAQGDRQFVIGIGGIVRTIVLDAKGKGQAGDAKLLFSGSPKDGVQKFSLKLSRADLANELRDDGYTPVEFKNVVVPLNVWIWFDGRLYSQPLQPRYTTRAGKSGSATAR
ncbi:MAG TPA: PKD domain-containing protein [Planctomycetota bacterium]|nr:PKD domain-containing protein [Planctomycetota bacterium]